MELISLRGDDVHFLLVDRNDQFVKSGDEFGEAFVGKDLDRTVGSELSVVSISGLVE